MWHWIVLAVGGFALLIAIASMRVYGREYERRVKLYGRARFGKEYWTSWTRADVRGVNMAQVQWLLGPIVLVGVLLYFLTGLSDRSLVLWMGVSLGIGSLLSLLWSRVASLGLAKDEVEAALKHSDPEQ
jgi:hypothetical protein